MKPIANALIALAATGVLAAAESDAATLLRERCFDCHDHTERKGGLDLEAIAAAKDPARDGAAWRKVEVRVRDHEMPPQKQPQPTEEERQQLVAWVRGLRAGIAPDPGRTLGHRLNRAEYANAVRDLLGVPIDAAALLPADEIMLGFDDIAESLTISPLLLEKYLLAADEIVDRALLPGRCELHLPGASDAGSPWTRTARGKGWTLASELLIPVDDPCAISLRLEDLPAGGQALRVALDDGPERTWPLAPAANTATTIAFSAAPLAGRHRIALTWEPQADAVGGGPRLAWLSVIGSPAARPGSGQRLVLPDEVMRIADARERARAALRRFASRAYRRPAKADEVERLLAIYDLVAKEGADFAVALRAPLKAVLVSPAFLIRTEPDPPGLKPGEAYRLGARELATRLSFFLWSSLPDDELAGEAESGALLKPGEVERQARRMLVDPRAQAFVERFVTQWLQLDHLGETARDVRLYSADIFDPVTWVFNPELEHAMLAEATCVFSGLLREDRSIVELLDADYTYLNERLARHYGIEGVRGPEMRRVQLPDRTRGGLISMACVLTASSTSDGTSAVKRGKWVLEQLLDDTPPPPPNAAKAQLPDRAHRPKDRSARALMEAHRSDAVCASCHRRMDPLGFGLDSYDSIGRWRTTEQDLPIDASGELPGGVRFNGPLELKALLAGELRDDFARALTSRLLTYALGRCLAEADQAVVDRLVDRLRRDGYRLPSLVLGIIDSYPFQYRRAARDSGGGP
jgi:hypothetical protein